MKAEPVSEKKVEKESSPGVLSEGITPEVGVWGGGRKVAIKWWGMGGGGGGNTITSI